MIITKEEYLMTSFQLHEINFSIEEGRNNSQLDFSTFEEANL